MTTPPATYATADELAAAIALRDRRGAEMAAADRMLAAGRAAGVADLRPLIQNYNDRQHDYEWAVRQAVRVRVLHQTVRGAA